MSVLMKIAGIISPRWRDKMLIDRVVVEIVESILGSPESWDLDEIGGGGVFFIIENHKYRVVAHDRLMNVFAKKSLGERVEWKPVLRVTGYEFLNRIADARATMLRVARHERERRRTNVNPQCNGFPRIDTHDLESDPDRRFEIQGFRANIVTPELISIRGDLSSHYRQTTAALERKQIEAFRDWLIYWTSGSEEVGE